MKEKNSGWNPNQTIFHQNTFNYDDYDEDGNLIENESIYGNVSSYSSKIIDYGRRYLDASISASARWASKYRTANYYNSEYYSKLTLESELSKELKSIARAVNSVRNIRSKKSDAKLKVAWATGEQRNNMIADPIIWISPDPFVDSTTMKSDWSKDKRRDVLIGGALTAVGMKRMTTPMQVKKIMKALNAERVRISSEMDGIEDITLTNNQLIRNLSIAMWKSLEQNAGRAEIMREYRGSLPYFAANQLYHSDDARRQDLINRISDFEDDLEEKIKNKSDIVKGISLVAADAINWNLNHSLIEDEKIPFPNNLFGEICQEAIDILNEGATKKTTNERWQSAHAAASIISQIEPSQEGEDGDGESDQEDGDGNSQNNAQGNEGRGQEQNADDKTVSVPAEMLEKLQSYKDEMFDKIENGVSVEGIQDCDTVEDDHVDGLTEASKDCKFQFMKHKSSDTLSQLIANDRAYNKETFNRIVKKLDPISEMNILPEHGLRSGRMTNSKLWKVTTKSLDSDRIFHRKIVNGIHRNLTIGILMDYSGSMSGSITMQRRIAVLMNDVLNRYPNIKVLNFSHQGGSRYNDVKGFESLEALADHDCGGGTEEGAAYAMCARKIIQEGDRKSRKILFAIGDGCSDRESIKHSVSLARNAGVETVDILLSYGGRSGHDRLFEQCEEAYGKGQVAIIQPDQAESQITTILVPWMTRLMSKLRKEIV